MDRSEHDARERRCPMLGHPVAFAYCRQPGKDLPCRKLLDCWFETFDVRSFVQEHLSEDQIRQAEAREEEVFFGVTKANRWQWDRAGMLAEMGRLGQDGQALASYIVGRVEQIEGQKNKGVQSVSRQPSRD